jgi:diguanylate cyclase (GGDEF)-like protein
LNDTHGHAAGDDALRDVASALRSDLRTADHAFRIGGDEFAVILPEATEADANAAAERIVESAQRSPRPWEWKLTMSVGVALCDSQRDSAALLRAADEAMYQMKRRRQACIATDLGDGDLAAVV